MCFDLVGLPGNDPILVLALAAPHLAVPDPTPETVDNQVRFLVCKNKSIYFRCIHNACILIFIVDKLPKEKIAAEMVCNCCWLLMFQLRCLARLISSYFNYQVTITHYFLVLLENIFINKFVLSTGCLF